MRHADAELTLWLANTEIEQRHREAELEHEARLSRSTASPQQTLRQRAGRAVIKLGERVAGEDRARRPAHKLVAS